MQDFEAQLFSTNVELEMAFGMENIGVPRAEMKRRVEQLLPLVRLEGMRGKEPSTLSDGQKQRLALAQVVVQDPALLILDEATSALDSVTENKVVAFFSDWRRNKTTLIIAHRFSAIRNVDRIIYLAGDGSLLSGRHEELMARVPAYEDAVKLQKQE